MAFGPLGVKENSCCLCGLFEGSFCLNSCFEGHSVE
jgi:hypothetical protein